MPLNITAEPSIYDQIFYVTNLVCQTTADGGLTFDVLSEQQSTSLRPNQALTPHTELTDMIQMQVGSFYVPKLPTWNLSYISYINRICMNIVALDSQSAIDYRIVTGALSTYRVTFEFKLTDVGDRYLLEPLPLSESVIFKTVMPIRETTRIYFSTPDFDLPLISPLIRGYVSNAAAGEITTGHPGGPVESNHFSSGNYIRFLLTESGLNPSSFAGQQFYNTIHQITVTGPNTFTISPNTVATFDDETQVLLANISWQIRIPLRARSLQHLNLQSNRIAPVAN